MKYGVNTFIWTANFDRSNLHLLPAIKAAGFDGVEVPLFQPSQFAARTSARASRTTAWSAPSARS
jgi:D-psicose/D-tagatose/L-ribulose 3-epimerase